LAALQDPTDVTIVSLDKVEKTFVVRTKAGRLRRTRTVVGAVDDVSFSVAAGSTVGYIGPNGACPMLQHVPARLAGHLGWGLHSF
jgi:ABC-2 type transport system ATP-binding protein